ncbi:tRNA (adenosine(37)-N6)-dimethylallyltransferase MiaA [Fervidibacillus halotolerans]|uniref:tRNA dimethylallyltransferase n=1 Tax=Fervidibacillus halotolerans TaxID=2980027 RepID=A0A9E8RZ43_9BACI|nr:tRNA (adenosine(37)-N6)-dimethylallyltransferase MiaA [Fervidibacillus halotolerans]WAA13516.1 tRNA (adenosine(37)-N6)-dimethylallyltransferase MiaA [Fervidibacillus halotolerans]
MEKKEKLLVIIGPTAVGKTKLSIDLAKKLSGEIISGDSMQIYRGMDIGTAKISPDEMEGIPHHLLDIKNPDESFSVAEFQQLVREKITEISNWGRLPILVGGTGLYIQSVIYNYQFPNVEGKLREQLEKQAEQEGIDFLYRKLLNIDHEYAQLIHPNNKRRVIRALEVYYSTGKTMTEWQKNQMKDPIYDSLIIGLTMERNRLYERINERVDEMIDNGLVQEAKMLYDQGLTDVQSTQAIGYKELFDYFDGKVTLEEAISNLKQNTRKFAKRQLTWFRNKMDVHWFDATDVTYEIFFEKICNFIAGKMK